MASTYLLHGPQGCGRWATAISIAALLNCERPVGSDDLPPAPCGTCRPCRTIGDLNFEGLLFALPLAPHKTTDERMELTTEFLNKKRESPFGLMMSASSVSIPIDVAREIKRDLARKVSGDFRRVVIFYEMHMMRQSSADALLKMIEEPPPDTTIIMISSQSDMLLPTIISRSQKVKIDRISHKLIRKEIDKTETVSAKRADLYARLAEGSIGQALNMVEGGEDDDSAASRAVGFMLFKSLVWDSKPETVSHLNDMISARNLSEANALLKLWQSLIRDCGAYAVNGDDEDITNVDFAAELIKIAPHFSEPSVSLAMVADIKITLADLGRNVHIPGALTGLALKLKANLDLHS